MKIQAVKSKEYSKTIDIIEKEVIKMSIQEFSSDFLYYVDTAQTKIQDSQRVQELFAKTINVGEAIVNVLGANGIAGFRFHIPLTEQIKMENEITDHFIDTNSAVQDHIAQKATIITLTGLQGEYFYSANEIQDMLAKITPTMSLVKQFLPKVDAATQQSKIRKAKEEAAKFSPENGIISGGVTKGVNDFNGIDLYKAFQNIYKLKSAQTRAFLFFEAMFKAKALFSIETTYKRFDNMAILLLMPKRDENADITDFTVSFKQIRFTESKSESINNAAGRTALQMSKPVNKGLCKGLEVNAI